MRTCGRVSGFQGFRFRGFRVSRFQGLRVSGFRVSGFQGFGNQHTCSMNTYQAVHAQLSFTHTEMSKSKKGEDQESHEDEIKELAEASHEGYGYGEESHAGYGYEESRC